MNILHLAIGDPETFGGVETHIRNLRRVTEAVGCRSLVRTLPGINDDQTPAPAETTLPVVGFTDALARLLRDEAVDVVHSHNVHLQGTPGLGPRLESALHGAGVPHLAQVHDVLHTDRRAAALFETAHVLTTSPYITREFTAGFGRKPLAQFAPVFDVRAAPFARDPEPRTVALPARLSPSKGGVEAVRFLGQLTRSVGPLRLLLSARAGVATPVDAAYLERLERSASYFPNLELAFNEAGDPWSMLERAAVVLATPRSPEGYGLAPAEALLRGRPVAATPTGGMVWLRGWPGVRTVRGRDIFALAEGVADMLERNAGWRAAALRARALLLQMHDEGRVGRLHRKLYEEVVKRGPVRRA